MSDEELIEDARKWIRLHENNKYQREAAKRMRRLTDRLEATIKEMHARELHHFEAEQERAAALAVIEEAREHVARVIAAPIASDWRVRSVWRILSSVPADVLRERDAEKWDEGAKAMMRAASEEQTVSLIAPWNPYRIEQNSEGNET